MIQNRPDSTDYSYCAIHLLHFVLKDSLLLLLLLQHSQKLLVVCLKLFVFYSVVLGLAKMAEFHLKLLKQWIILTFAQLFNAVSHEVPRLRWHIFLFDSSVLEDMPYHSLEFFNLKLLIYFCLILYFFQFKLRYLSFKLTYLLSVLI